MKNIAIGLCVLVALAVVLPMVLAEDEPEPPRPRRGRGMPPGGMWERLKAMDGDGDGKISREEFEGPDRFFERLDEDEDGFVTQAETEALTQRMRERRGGERERRGGERENQPRPPAPTTGITLEMVDADRDGKATLGEWTAFFGAADADQDGIISAEEWEKILKPVTKPGGRAPHVGEAAPDVKAVSLTRDDVVVDLGMPERVTVLIFGSWT